MSEYRYRGFSPARHREDRTQLAPPLRRLPEWSLPDVAYGPIILGDRLIVSRRAGEVAAYHRESAEPLWSHALPGPVSPPAAAGTIACAGERLLVAFKNELIVLHVESGAVISRHEAPAINLEDAFGDGDLLFCKLWDGGLEFAAWDLHRGEFAWRRKVAPSGGQPSALSGDLVVFWGEKDRLVAADATSGAERWQVPVAEVGRHIDALGANRGGELRGPPIALGDQIITRVAAHHLLSLDRQSGRQRWLTRVENHNLSGLAAYPDGRLYLLGQYNLDRLDAAGGARIDCRDLKAEMHRCDVFPDFGTLGVSDEYLFAVGGLQLIAIHLERGTIDWQFKLNAKVSLGSAPILLDGRLYLFDLNGESYVFAR